MPAPGRKPQSDANLHRDLTRDQAPNLALPWVIKLRYGVLSGEALIVLGMAYAFHVEFPVASTLAPLGLILTSNLWLHRRPEVSVRFPQQTLGVVFVLDTLCLTLMLGLTGGPLNPFSLLYLVQISLSAVVLRKAWTWALGALATVCFGLLFFLHLPLAALQTHQSEGGVSPHLVGMWIAFIVGSGLITFFTGTVSDALRRREQEILALQEQIAKSERLASLVTLAAGAAHELGTPLGTIAVVSRELERLAANLPDASAMGEDAKLIRSEVERCRLILQRMSAEGAEPMGEMPRTVRLGDLIRQVLEQFPKAQRRNFSADVPNHDAVVQLPVQATIQSLAALMQNALDASDGGQVVVRAIGSGSVVAFSVRDQGSGMSESVLRRIAEPFFTTKEPGKGMGLGTFLARTFAERLGGGLTFESALGEGTTATLTLPVNASHNAHASV
jgi:two-component system sensor histidine kinase RegB